MEDRDDNDSDFSFSQHFDRPSPRCRFASYKSWHPRAPMRKNRYFFIRVRSRRTDVLLSILEVDPIFPESVQRRLSSSGVRESSPEETPLHIWADVFKEHAEDHCRKKPDIVFCTHALPSYLLNRLKVQYPGLIVVNVYTDFFVNRIWGREHIDYHFAPIKDIKDQLISEGVDEGKIFLTGIPIHHSYKTAAAFMEEEGTQPHYNILITGGSMGVGGIFKLVRELA